MNLRPPDWRAGAHNFCTRYWSLEGSLTQLEYTLSIHLIVTTICLYPSLTPITFKGTSKSLATSRSQLEKWQIWGHWNPTILTAKIVILNMGRFYKFKEIAPHQSIWPHVYPSNEGGVGFCKFCEGYFKKKINQNLPPISWTNIWGDACHMFATYSASNWLGVIILANGRSSSL